MPVEYIESPTKITPNQEGSGISWADALATVRRVSKEPSKDVYKQLSEVDVEKHIQKKGKFSYLSWADALATVLRIYPDMMWEEEMFDNGDGARLPYLKTETGFFVGVRINIGGISRSLLHPVLDHNNRTVKQPDAFQINTSLKRAFTKCLALHGLGLYIFQGEDTPEILYTEYEEEMFNELIKGHDPFGWTVFVHEAPLDSLAELQRMHMYSHYEAKTAAKEKHRIKELEAAGHVEADEIADKLKAFLVDEDDNGALETWSEMSAGEKRLIWARLDKEQREQITYIKERHTI